MRTVALPMPLSAASAASDCSFTVCGTRGSFVVSASCTVTSPPAICTFRSRPNETMSRLNPGYLTVARAARTWASEMSGMMRGCNPIAQRRNQGLAGLGVRLWLAVDPRPACIQARLGEAWLHSAPPVRYLKVTLFIAFIVSLLVAGLYELGLLYQFDLALAGMLHLHAPPVFSDRAWQYPLVIGSAIAVAWATVDIPRKSLKCVVAAVAFLEVIAASWIIQMFSGFFSPFATLTAIALKAPCRRRFIYARTALADAEKNVSTSSWRPRLEDDFRSAGEYRTLSARL